MARMRQPDEKVQDQNGTRTRQRIASDRSEGNEAVISRISGAALRAALVVLLIVTPSIMLPSEGADSGQFAVMVALCAALFTLVEYTSASPSIIAFRAAPPFNRLRFGALFLTVFSLCVVFSGSDEAGTLTLIAQEIGQRIGASIDFAYSPVRLMLLALSNESSVADIQNVRAAAGLSYIISLLSLAIFVSLLRMRGWPKKAGTFNVWINLPTFDPAAGGDVVDRLNRSSQINLILGFLLPFLVPAIMKIVALMVGPIVLTDPHTMIWAVSAWAFLPASLLMRGVALSRVAQMIYVQRKRAYAKAAADGLLPA
jgi:hypothetical protein